MSCYGSCIWKANMPRERITNCCRDSISTPDWIHFSNFGASSWNYNRIHLFSCLRCIPVFVSLHLPCIVSALRLTEHKTRFWNKRTIIWRPSDLCRRRYTNDLLSFFSPSFCLYSNPQRWFCARRGRALIYGHFVFPSVYVSSIRLKHISVSI